MSSISFHRVTRLRRRAALGMATTAMLMAVGMATATDLEPARATPASLRAVQAEETLFPLGKPPALIEATGGSAMLWLDDAPVTEPDRISTGAILSLRSLAGMSAFALPGRVMPAERHIVVGLMLLAAAGMAAFSFGLWRWQVRGLAGEA